MRTYSGVKETWLQNHHQIMCFSKTQQPCEILWSAFLLGIRYMPQYPDTEPHIICYSGKNMSHHSKQVSVNKSGIKGRPFLGICRMLQKLLSSSISIYGRFKKKEWCQTNQCTKKTIKKCLMRYKAVHTMSKI